MKRFSCDDCSFFGTRAEAKTHLDNNPSHALTPKHVGLEHEEA